MRRPSVTPEQTRLVEDSFAKLGPVRTEMGIAFYDELFELAPDLRELFERDHAEQAMQFIQVLAYIVSNLRASEQLLPMVRDLGRRHASYGVVQAHYAPFRQALLATLQRRLQDQWTPELADAWRATFDTLAREMLAGAVGA